MGNFKDELKKNMKNQEEEKRRLEAQINNFVLPEDELKQMVDIMVRIIKEDISNQVYRKGMTYDWGGFRKKKQVNHRYEYFHKMTPIQASIQEMSLSFKGIKEPSGNYLVPTSKYFFEYWDDLWFKLNYVNKNHIDQLFTALVEKLRQEGITAAYNIYTKEESYKGGVHKEISFKAYIKCDKDGNI